MRFLAQRKKNTVFKVHYNQTGEEAQHRVALNIFSQMRDHQVDQKRYEDKYGRDEINNGIDVE